MEAVAVIIGLLFIVAFGLSLIGVPLLFKKLAQVKTELALLKLKVDAQLTSTAVATDTPKAATLSERLQEQTDVQAAAAEAIIAIDSEPVAQPEPGPVLSKPVTKDVADQSNAADSDVEILDAPPWSEQGKSEARPAEPSAFQEVWQGVLQKLLSMNITAQVGAVVLIFGAVFLGKYASDIGVLTLDAKLWLMGVFSVAVATLGIVFYRRLQLYGEILQGTGFAGFLVTLFVTHVLFARLHWLTVLLLGVGAVVIIAIRAWKQDSQVLAMVAFLGGFLTPFIAASEQASLWRLFAYLSLLNISVVVITRHKLWRWLVREAYVGSFGLLAALALAEYLQNDLDQLAVQLPMAAYCLLVTVSFSLLALSWLTNEQLQFKRHVSGLLFGVPATAAISFQLIFHKTPHYTAMALALIGLWYVGLWLLSRRVYFIGIGIVLLSAALPFALSDSLTSIVYSLEGAAFAYWAMVHKHKPSFVWGVGLQLLAACFAFRLFLDAQVVNSSLNLAWVLYGAVVISGVFTAWHLNLKKQPFSSVVEWIERAAIGWSVFIWLYLWAFWLAEQLSAKLSLFCFALVVAVSTALVQCAGWRWNWHNLKASTPYLNMMFVVVAGIYLVDYHARVQLWFLLALSLVSLCLFALRWVSVRARQRNLQHWDALVTWFGLLTVTTVALANIPTMNTDWNLVLGMLIPVAAGWFLQPALKHLFSPSPIRRSARWISLSILLCLSVVTFARLGNYAPLPFWPLVHPLVLLATAIGLVFARFTRHDRRLKTAFIVWAGVLVTTDLNRYLFHYAGVPYNLDSWLQSALTQTVWSLVWAAIGGALMVLGARVMKSRTLWFTGSVILAFIVLKLFIVDLAQIGTLFRIFSFIGVGILLLVIGYFAPLPEADKTSEAAVDAQQGAE